MLNKFDIGDKVTVVETGDCHQVKAMFSNNPGGPYTYYECSDGETYHLSQLAPVADPKMTRQSILDEAMKIVSQDRNLDYGAPEDNFRDIAKLWGTYNGITFTAADVAVMMILVKISRLKTSPGKSDHWVDIAGYAACGGQSHDAS